MTATLPAIYPTRDGRPIGGSDLHRDQIFYLIAALKVHFREQPNVYVSGNNFVFWQEGKPKLRVSPDTYVVFGPDSRLRDSYLAWKEGGRLPGVVIEVTSRSAKMSKRRCRCMSRHSKRLNTSFLTPPAIT